MGQEEQEKLMAIAKLVGGATLLGLTFLGWVYLGSKIREDIERAWGELE